MRPNATTSLLLIEDNRGDARLLVELLNDDPGVKVDITQVSSMNAAEVHLAQHVADIILLDLELPDAHGLEAVRRSRAAAPSVALVVLTGMDDESLALQALQEGAQDYLVKGQIETRGLVRALRHAMERQNLEEALSAQQERDQFTLNCLGDAVASTDISGNITFLNIQAEKLTGWLREDAEGRPIDEVIHILRRGTDRPVSDTLGMSGQQERIDSSPSSSILVRRDGFEAPIEDSVAPIHDRQGRATGAVIVFRDISVRRAADTQLAQMEGRYRGLLEAAPDAMVVVNQAGEIVLLNVQAEKQFGYRRDELLGQPVKNLIPEGFAERLVADDLRSAEDALDQTIGTGIELMALRKDGSAFPIEIMLSPLDSAEGVLITAAIRDISVRRAAETHLGQMEGRYRGLLEAAPDAMVVVNQAGEIVLLNVQAEKQFGYRRDELLGQPVKNLIPEGFAERLVADDLRSAEDALDQTIGTGIELMALRKDGSAFPIEIMLSPLDSAEGVLITAAIRDISVRRAAETHLGQMEGRYRGLLEAAPDAMVVVNQAGEIVLLNVQAEKQFGYRRDELLGQPVKNLIPEGFAERLVADDLRSAEDALDQTIGTGIELMALRKDGSAFPIEIMLSPLDSAEGVLITAAIRDISVRRAMARQMTHSAEHDFLTGLPNRLLLVDRVGQAIALAQRRGNKIALLYLDLDGFKHINDSLGHPTGDKVLQSVAKRLEACVRTSDTVSRQGGDEFVLLLSDLNRWESATATALRIKASLERAHDIDQRDLHITASIGISIYPDDGVDAETLIKNADTAMYQAKENGRQSYQFFKAAMYVKAVQRQSIEASLRRALDRDEFTLHYQPKVSLTTGDITGAEALIRWTHPTRGTMPPADFIPIAEDSGLILPIGKWVLREACRQAKVWVDDGLFPGTMAVNISAVEFRSDSFLDGVFSILDETGLDPRSLELELTESVLMKRAESAEISIRALRARGIDVSIDDFGTGYSSLSYLRKFQIDALKIDQSFVREISAVPAETGIVTAVISMGRSLNLRVIAEGVETQEDVTFLKLLNCDEAQGYFFSRPVPPLQFVKLLEQGRFALIESDLVQSGEAVLEVTAG